MKTTVEQADAATIDEMLHYIVKAVNPLRVLLFGSAARGQMDQDSDLDVLVVVPDGTHCLNTTQHLYKELFDFGFPVDILVATSTMLEKHKDNIGLIYHRILEEGKEIYAS